METTAAITLQWFSLRRVLVSVGLIGLAIVIGGLLWMQLRSGIPTDGPLLGSDPEGVSMSAQPNHEVSWGGVQIFDTSQKPLVLESVSLNDATPGLKIHHVRVVLFRELNRDPNARGAFPTWPSWPIPQRLEPQHPFAGFTLAPGGAPRPLSADEKGVQVIVGLSVDGKGVYRTQGLRIRYRVGGKEFILNDSYRFTICSPANFAGECPT